MSDFLTRLLNRHTGVGEQVRPRLRTRFEPDVSAASPVYDSPEIAEMNTKVHLDRRQPGSISESPVAAVQAVSEATAYTEKRVVTDGHLPVNTLQQEATIQNASEDTSVASAGSFEKGLEEKAQNVREQRVSASREVNSNEMSQTDNPLRIVAISGHDESRNLSGDKPEPTASERPSEISVSFANQQRGVTESRPVAVALENTIADSPVLPAIPTWLSDRKSQLQMELYVEDSKAEVEPAVNVTIGRIEVRAIVSEKSKQPSRKAKSSGVMSLDKYLHQRTRRMNR